MRSSTRWNRSPSHELDAMVMAPALPNLRPMGVRSADNNPPPSKAKVDTGVSNHAEDEDMVSVDLKDQQALGIWNAFKNAEDPSHVSHLYRQYKNSRHCSLTRDTLRRMRDVMIADMKEKNSEAKNPRKQTQRGRNAPTWDDAQFFIRRGA